MNDDDSTPVMFDHCCKVFQVMQNESKIVEVDGGVKIAVWEGYLTRLIQGDLGLAVPYYTAIRSNLIRMGCVRQMRRGGGNSPSQWEVIKPPSADEFNNAPDTGNASRRRRESHSQQINDLSHRVQRLELNERTFIEAINSLTDQLNKLMADNGDDNGKAA